MSERRPLDLQRLRHVPRELLRSRDLRDEVAFDAELLWWHQRAVHDAFGIATGLNIEPADDATVWVEPGVAFDCYGRDLVLLHGRLVALPETDDDELVLVARYRADERGCCADCRRRDTLELVWRERSRVDSRSGVPLATIQTREGTVLPPPRRARPFARPALGAGATPVDGTPWQPFGPYGRPVGIEVRIDTRSAGFTETPCYFAWLNWPRLTSSPQWTATYFALAHQYVEESTIDGFTYRVWLSEVTRADAIMALVARRGPLVSRLLSLVRQECLFVSWLALQPAETSTSDPKRRDRHEHL